MASRTRSTTSTKSSTTRTPTRRATGRSPGGSTPRGRSTPTQARRSAFAGIVEGHGGDLWGVALLILAVVIGVAVYTSTAGPFGDGVHWLVTALVGKLSYLVPPALVAGGVLLIVGPRHSNAADGASAATDGEPGGSNRPSRVALFTGTFLGVTAIAGVLHLLFADGADLTRDGLRAYAPGAGFYGAAPGSLAYVLGRWGAFVVLLLVLVVALSLVTGWSLRQMFSGVARAAAPGARAGADWFSDLFHLGGSRPEAGGRDEAEGAHDESTAELFDQDAGGETSVKPKRKRAKAEDKPAGPRVVVAQPEPFDPAAETEQMSIDLGPAAEGSAWKLPPPSLLSVSKKRTVDTAKVEERGQVLERALAEHGVETRLVGMVVGPTVTRYELELGVGVKVARITSLNKDIAYAMASPDVRILAPIPGRQAIGVEVPNEDREVVALGDILNSAEARRATHPLEVGVGRDITGAAVLMNLAKMPHVLIAGQTGAGKSSCINSLITSILMRTTPEQVRMILIDPKQVELTQYNRIPHLLTQVVTNPKKAANALAWAVNEMERRYGLLSEAGVRDIGGYNAAFDRGELAPPPGVELEPKRLPFILVVVDELADLMMVASRDVEESINRIAAKARAVGIHLVIATQRPSVNVITGVIKANIPSRLAFAVSSSTDSKVILDQVGAERLVGMGDMLLLDASSPTAQRIQGSWVEESEVAAIVSRWRQQTPDVDEHYVKGVADEEITPSAGGSVVGGGSNGTDDDLVAQATELVVRSGLGSTSMLQRKLKVGFARAGRLMDELEERGVVGPSEGSKARTVLLTPEDLDNMIEAGEF